MILLRFLSRVRCLAAMLLLVAGTSVASADVFTIRGISVDATGEDVIAAKEAAIRQGQSQALERLWDRLVQVQDRATVPPVLASDIERFVQNFSVSDERTSDVRYIADMTVQFAAQPVRDHLRFAGVPFVDKPAPTAVVLPIYADVAGEQLWQSGNPWLEAWVSSFTRDSLSPIIAPLGDLADMSLIDAQRAAAGDRVAVQAFAEHYRVENAIVTRASMVGDQSLEVSYQEIGTPDRAGRFAMVKGADETPEELLLRAVIETQGRLEQAWRQANTVRFDQQAQLIALIPLRSLDDWIAIQEDLGAIPAVASTKVLSMTREAAVIDLAYYGPSEQLAAFFRQRRLSIRPIDFINDPDTARLLERRSTLPTWQIGRL